jgi:cytochrome c oxidase assembly protein subunit 15
LRCAVSPLEFTAAVLAVKEFGCPVPAPIDTAAPSLELHRFAIVCASATFVLIFVGGLVTSTGSALAVPDWPLAFGRLIPPLVGGIRFEWGHRLVAGAVSILTLILALWTWRREPRQWVRITAFAALGLIVVQAVLGGLTVLMLLPLALAVAHAATAQAFFCVMIAMVVFTSPGFGRPADGNEVELPRNRLPLTALGTATTAAIYLQILIGAVMRHLGAGLAIPDFPTSYGSLIPPFYSFAVDINFAHRCGASVVTLMVGWTFARVMRSYSAERRLRNGAIQMLGLLALQITLGALTIWSGRAVLPTTAHVAIGAALLGATVALTIRAYEVTVRTRTRDILIAAPTPRAMRREVPA